MLFNNGWTFQKRPLDGGLDTLAMDDFSPVEIPHDWLIYDTLNLYEDGEGWYRKVFQRPQSERAVLLFDGVYMDSSVFINREKAFEWKYGYSAFEVDMTPYLKDGENEIIVRVRHQAPNSRWYSGAGIFRNVRIRLTGKDYLVENGAYVTPVLLSDGTWRVDIETEVACDGPYTLLHTVYDADGQVAAQGDTPVIAVPRLWTLDDPHCYTLETRLMAGDVEKDRQTTVFGLRSLRFDPDNGFFLNEKHVKLYGVCEHHDLGALGAAFNTAAMRRKLTLLKTMGVNALRTSHNMPAKAAMHLCDEMGILVVSEAFDMWERSKTTYDYARFFPQWMARDVRSWIRRDRNHPSLILWSIGNEIYDTHASQRGQEVTVMLSQEVRRHDPKAHAPITIGSNYMPWENANKCADLVDAAGYNYAERLYEKHHAQYPSRVIYGAETASTVQSRGIYHFPLIQSVLADDDEQCSSLGNSTTSWGAKNTEYNILMDRDAAFSLGQFIWTGFDYIGEPTPYHTKNAYFGQLDTAGFPKDSFYLYQAAWTDWRTAPMVHITPYWDFSPGQPIDVRVCSNAPRIELFLNDVSLGAYDIDHGKGDCLGRNWVVPYQEGVLTAKAYDDQGRVIAVDEQASFGEAARLKLSADKKTLRADGMDLVFVEIAALDSSGWPVHNANNRVYVSVSGAGRLVGLDNGDSTDYDAYKGTSRRLFSGKLLAIVAATHEAGEISVTVASPGLLDAQLTLRAEEAPIAPGACGTFLQNALSDALDEIPVRKITLTPQGALHLNAQTPTVAVQAAIYPKNATYHDLTFRLTNRAGVTSNLADLSVSGDTATITARGDGEVWLRAMTHNGREGYSVISQMPFTISGVGAATLDPYGFIAGGLYNASNLPMTNGNDRGVATLRDDVSHVGFKGVDFGPYGSDTIHLPIFAMDQGLFDIEIWEGMPGEDGAEKVDTVAYTLGSIWNTYQTQTCRLSRRFKGVTTVCFVVNRKIHLKGFSFEKLDKAAALLYAGECDALYGDAFTRAGNAIEGIGNNVSVVFEQMAFAGGNYALTVTGRTPLDKNTLQVVLQDGEDSLRHLMEFMHADAYEQQATRLHILKGVYKVTFIFLPGCVFDFESFQFRNEEA